MPPEEPPEFPVVPLNGVTELRIHGVSGTPVPAMLVDPHPVQVWGDGTAGFYRRPTDGNDGTDHLEAYSWGGLTAKSARRALWLLLLPFMLVNVASWAHPPRRGTRSGPVGTMSGALRLVGLTLTLTFVLATAVLTVDVLAWQCGSIDACASPHWYTRWMTGTRAGLRLVVGAVFPALLVLGIAYLSRSSTQAYEQWGDDEAPLLADPDGTPDGVKDMGNRRFWQGRGPVTRLRAMHVTGSFAFLAALVAYAARSLDTGASRAAGVTIAAVAAALVACVAVVLTTPHAGRRRDLFERRPPGHAFCRTVMVSPYAAAALFLAALAYAATQPAAAPAGTPLPGAQGAKHALVAVQALGLAVLFGANLAAHAARDRTTPDSVRGALLRGQLATFLAVAGCAVASAFAAGLTFRIADYLGCPGDCETGVVDFDLPAEYLTAGRAFFATAVLAGLAALYVFLVTRRRAVRAALPNVVTEYPGHTDEARRATIAKVHGGATLTDHATWPLAIAVVGGIAIGIAYSYVPGLPADDRVAGWGTWLVGAFALGLVLVGRLAYRSASLRRTVGILWDLGTFWPRAVHPFAPPCYCERTVPEYVTRIEQLRDGGGRVVMSAHSQGTVIAFAALLQLRDQPDSLALVTYGSPLHRLYARAFPHFFGLPVLGHARNVLGDRWVNLYRRSDPIGGPVTCGDGDVPAAALRPDRRLHDPAFAKPGYAFSFPVARGHSNYFHDPAFAQTVGTLAGEVRTR